MPPKFLLDGGLELTLLPNVGRLQGLLHTAAMPLARTDTIAYHPDS